MDKQSAAPAQPGLAATRRILVVDDNRDSAESLALLLELRGFEIRIAFDGQSALATARSFQPDVIILDIGLPVMDGYEVARRLREEGVTCQLVALTGYGQDEDRKRSREAGFDHHLIKPVDLATLAQILTP